MGARGFEPRTSSLSGRPDSLPSPSRTGHLGCRIIAARGAVRVPDGEDPRRSIADGGPLRACFCCSRPAYFTLKLRQAVLAAVFAAVLAIVARMR